MLVVFLRASLGNTPDVDDLFQETMIVAWRRLDDFDHTRPFGPWLRGIARKLVLEQHRKRARNFQNSTVLDQLESRLDQIASQPGDTWDEKLELLRDLRPDIARTLSRSCHRTLLPTTSNSAGVGNPGAQRGNRQKAIATRAIFGSELYAKQAGDGILKMNGKSNHDDVNLHSSAWLDDDDGTPPIDSKLSADDQARIADLQLIDALLSDLSHGENDERATRIRRAMAAIEASEPSAQPKRQNAKLGKSAMAIAASLLLVLSLAWSQFSGESRANAILREIRDVTLESVDRVYDLRRYTSDSDEDQKVAAKLYLRGRDGFVLHGGDVVLGRNGDEFWLVPNQGNVLVAESFRWMVAETERSISELELLKQLSNDSRRVPIMQLSAVVELMKDDYDVSLGSSTADSRESDREHAIVGILQNKSANLPRKISLWADANSNIIRRAEFTWGPGNTMSLELTPAEDLPMKWYTHDAHHDGQRLVKRVKPTTS